jgi:hypothetical protein
MVEGVDYQLVRVGAVPPWVTGDVPKLMADIERTQSQMSNRSYATVYERAAWQHDIGEHAGSDYPFGFCPRCEMEHPLGRFAQLLAASKKVADMLACNHEFDPECARCEWMTPFRKALFGDGGDQSRSGGTCTPLLTDATRIGPESARHAAMEGDGGA